MRTASRFLGLAGAVCLALTTVTAQAGPLPLDPNALAGQKGTQAFLGAIGPFSIAANVEYAVYSPGTFNLSFPGQDPSANSHYVYAYQVYNTGIGANASDISIFTMGLASTSLATNIGSVAGFGLAPVNASFAGAPPSSGRWDYTPGSVPLGANSTILIFTSPKGPARQPGSVQGGGLSNTQPLPSPVPEPATLTLLGLGALALVAIARRRKS